MNRKTKIIVSIAGITLVGLMLLGLTYGYFVTKIVGNTNAKSISVSSAKKIVEYTDLSEEISGKIIEPGYETIKVFTVKNIGNRSATYHIYLDNVVNEFIRTQDITYTLYRKDGNNTIDTSNLSDSDIVASGILPKVNNYILVNETIETPDNYYTYALKINYINSEENQDEDQGHTFSFKVQLHAEIIDMIKESGTLANVIYESSQNVTSSNESLGYAKYRDTPVTALGASTLLSYDGIEKDNILRKSGIDLSDSQNSYNCATGYTVDQNTGRFTLTGITTCDDSSIVGKYFWVTYEHQLDDAKNPNYNVDYFRIAVVESVDTENIFRFREIFPKSLSKESALSKINDEYGTSYYFRGGVKNNYLDFAGMCWRIVRIQGDYSIKLVLYDANTTCSSSTGDWSSVLGMPFNATYNYGDNQDNSIKEWTDTGLKDWQKSKLSNYSVYLKNENWCYDSTLTNISLVCSGVQYSRYKDGTNMFVSGLTNSEVLLAGSESFYLYEGRKDLYWFTISFMNGMPAYVEKGRLNTDPDIVAWNGYTYNYVSIAQRPSIVLNSNVTVVSGDGTKTNAYKVI